MTDRRPRLLRRSHWASHPTLWKGHVEGITLDTNVTVLFYSTEEVGRGLVWHVHPYDEIFIIREGRALFTVGEIRIEPEAGRIVFGPANIPHKFHIVSPGHLDATDIHVSGSRPISTTRKPDPDQKARPAARRASPSGSQITSRSRRARRQS